VLTGQHLLLGGQGGSSRGGLRWTMDGERDPVRLRGGWEASTSQLKRDGGRGEATGTMCILLWRDWHGGPGWSLVCVAELKSGGTQACSVGLWEGLDGEGLDSGSFAFKPLHDSCPGLARLRMQFYLKQKNLDFWVLMRSRLQGAELDLRGLERPGTGQDEWVWDFKIYPAYSYLIPGKQAR